MIIPDALSLDQTGQRDREIDPQVVVDQRPVAVAREPVLTVERAEHVALHQ